MTDITKILFSWFDFLHFASNLKLPKIKLMTLRKVSRSGSRYMNSTSFFLCQMPSDKLAEFIINICLTVSCVAHSQFMLCYILLRPSELCMGPVWAYWAFPMERHCSEILHNIRSRRFPYASINKYVTCQAQLTHITLLYNLHKKLQLKPPTSHDNNVCLPSCEPALMLTNMHADCYILDPSFILTPPKQSAVILPLFLWKTLTATLATHFDKSAAVICKPIPQNTYFVQYS